MSGKLRMGIMGTGRIVAQWTRDAAAVDEIEVTAIASRDEARARQAAQR